MSIPAEIHDFVRRRAKYACEYCGVTEVDVGGQLTVDHFRPRNQAGNDDVENLLYCCVRCNQYKAGYWPATPGELMLLNPRIQPPQDQLLLLSDGTVKGLSAEAEFTVGRLHLNRPELVAHRRRQADWTTEGHLQRQINELQSLLEQARRELSQLRGEAQGYLLMIEFLLKLLLEQDD
jgi:HNH endonuclease